MRLKETLRKYLLEKDLIMHKFVEMQIDQYALNYEKHYLKKNS